MKYLYKQMSFQVDRKEVVAYLSASLFLNRMLQVNLVVLKHLIIDLGVLIYQGSS